MDVRERIEQAIISAGAYTGEDTEALLSEIGKLYEKAQAWDNYCESVKEDLENAFGNDRKKIELGMELNNKVFMEDKQND